MTNDSTHSWGAAVIAALGSNIAAAALASAAPAGYDELNEPAVAVIDLEAIAVMAVGYLTLDTRLMRRSDNALRFRVYRQGQSIPLADMLPLLDQLGFRALDERAFVFETSDGPIWLHDVGVELAAGIELTAATTAEVQRTFVDQYNGIVEIDGFNRLVLAAGLTARHVEILRAYARYLRQVGFPSSQQSIESTLLRHMELEGVEVVCK